MALPVSVLRGGVLGAITGEPTFMATWQSVLLAEGGSVMEAALADGNAWQVRQAETCTCLLWYGRGVAGAAGSSMYTCCGSAS